MTTLIQKTIDHVRTLTSNEATGHDWQHTHRVTAMALRLAKAESDPVDEELIRLACLLHDVKDYKLSGDESAGPKAAYDWLCANDADPVLIENIVEIIATMSFKGQVDRPMSLREGMIVQDADRLDAVGAIGIARAFAFGGAHGREIVNPDIPYRKNLSSADYKNKTLPTTSLNHFYEKLLKLDGHYHTALANQIGHQRHEFMVAYVRELLEECGMTDTLWVI